MKKVKEKIVQLFENTVKNGEVYDGDLENVNYFTLMCKAKDEYMFKIGQCNGCMFKYKYDGKNSVLFIFSMPVNLNTDNGQDNKHISERVIDIVRMLEDCFVTIDYLNSIESKEDKFVYITAVKKIVKSERRSK
jgi:hypothetical protein